MKHPENIVTRVIARSVIGTSLLRKDPLRPKKQTGFWNVILKAISHSAAGTPSPTEKKA